MTLDISEHVPPSPRRDEEVLRILSHYYRKLLQVEQVPTGKALQLLPEYLLGWIRALLGTILSDEPPEGHPERFEYDQMMEKYEREKERICARLNVSEPSWRYTMQMVYSTAGASQLQPMWPSVLLHERLPQKHELRSIHACFLMEWSDGTFVPFSRFLPAELATAGGAPVANGLTDAVMANMLHKYVRSWINDLVTQGSDVLHDTEGKNYGGEHPYNVLMGMMLYIIEANIAVRDGTTVNLQKFAEEHGLTRQDMERLGKVVPQLDPKLLDYMKGYMRLCQAMIRPPMPREYRDEIARRRKLRLEAAQNKKIFGGWNG